ncbi:MAG: methyltransferase domain-containing protein [Armatimonadota bacterium]
MTDWEGAYVAGDTPWDKGQPSPALVAELRSNPLAGRVLVPGCGSGNDLPAVLAAGADEVVGLDFAPTAVVRARERFAGVSGIRIEHGDLFALPEAWSGAFDAAVEHTCFCAIPRERRPDYAASVARALRPGGTLLAVFYLTPRDDPDPTLGPPFSSDRDELRATFSPWFDSVSAGPPGAAFPERLGREEVWRLRRAG